VLVDVERAGVRIDSGALAVQGRHIEGELAARQSRIFELAGEEFNINSPKQLSAILFEKPLPCSAAARRRLPSTSSRNSPRPTNCRASSWTGAAG
jgi:DNA polymerase I